MPSSSPAARPRARPPARADARRSRDAILAAARELLADNATAGLDVVAARAGVHRATLYRHFATREALVAALYDAYLDDAEAAIVEADAEAADLRAEVEALTRRVYAVNVSWRTFAWGPAYGAEMRSRRTAMTQSAAALFSAAQRAGALRGDMPVDRLLITWGAPILYLAARVADGGWTMDDVVAHTMLLLEPPA